MVHFEYNIPFWQWDLDTIYVDKEKHTSYGFSMDGEHALSIMSYPSTTRRFLCGTP